MAESCKPTAAAVVAAPILKLWPAYSIAGRLAVVKAFLTSSTNLCLDKVLPLEKSSWRAPSSS